MSKKIAIILDYYKSNTHQILKGISSYIHKYQVDWTVISHNDPNFKMNDYVNWDGDGIIIDVEVPNSENIIRNSKCPVVSIGKIAEEPKNLIPYTQVYVNNQELSDLAIQHFQESGIRNLAFFGVSQENNVNLEEKKSYLSKGSSKREIPFYVFSKISFYDKKELMSWIEYLPKPIGVMCLDDLNARNFIEACKTLKVSIPEDVSILGIGNDDMICNTTQPSLSSIEIAAENIGYIAVESLAKQLNFIPTPFEMKVGARGVMVRSSTDHINIKDHIVKQGLECMDQLTFKSFTISKLCERMSVSKETLNRHFIKALGRSVHEEINRRQINRVKELLRETNWSQEKISQQCGFSSVQYLSNKFKYKVGMSPKKFRQTYKELSYH